ncbi:MAG: ATP-binding protein [Gemmatimonadota bacterium]
MAKGQPIIVRGKGAPPPGWEGVAGVTTELVLDGKASEVDTAALRRSDCALVDGSATDALEMARRVHAADASLQLVIVVGGEDRVRIERAILFTPGLGEVWIVQPDEISSPLLERASTVTRQRRSFRATRTRLEHGLAALEPRAGRRALISDAYLASLLAVLPDPVLSVDSAGTILSWNPAAERVLGYDSTEAVGTKLAAIVAPESAESIADLVRRASGRAQEEISFRRSDGEIGIAEIVIVPVDAAGHDVLAVVLHDITEERRAQAMLEEQAAEMEAQATELEAAQLELELANDDLQRANEELSVRTTEAERARREAEAVSARLEAVLQQMPSGVILAEAPSGRLLLGNQQVERIWRFPFLTSGTTGEYDRYPGFHPDGRQYRMEEWPIARSLKGELVLDEEIQIRRGDDTRGTISVSSAPIEDGDGRVVAAVAIFDDVTERKEREEQTAFLSEAGRVFAGSLDYVRTLRSIARSAVPRIADWCAVDVLEEGELQRLAVVHSDPAKEEVAQDIARRWPSDPDAPHGVPAVLRSGRSELIREITPDLLEAAARDGEHLRALREVGLRSAMIVPLIARDRTLGALTFIAAESGRLFDENDLIFAEQLASRAAYAVDNARLLRSAQIAREGAEAARAEAEAANQAKSDFLATMSHEIRTPINAIIGYTELLEMGLGGPITEDQAAHLGRVRSSSRHLLGLVEDILDLAKVEAGRMEVGRERNLVVGSIAAALALVLPQASEKNIQIEEACDGDSKTFYVGDEDRVRQILANLLSNAVKFTEAGGRIRVSCGVSDDRGTGETLEHGPWTFIRVSDTGVGIAPGEIERVFQPFEQVEQGRTRTRGGSGLGLTISRQLARLMGGDLTVESTVGEGSTFTLWLQNEVRPRQEVDEVVLAQVKDETPEHLLAVGRALAGNMESIVVSFRERLRELAIVNEGEDLGDADLEDHASTLLADVAQNLIAMATSRRMPENLVRDGSQIQRVISELHGVQRARLGWSEAAIRQEFDVLREEIERAVDDGTSPGADIGDALGLLGRFLEQAERISIESFRSASLRQEI